MKLYLQRHCEPIPGEREDSHRGLTAEGERQARVMAEFLQRQIGTVGIIVTSMFQRAIQTARIEADILGVTRVPETSFLNPDANPEQAWDAIKAAANGIDDVLVVGHHPSINHLLEQLTGSKTDVDHFHHGAIAHVKPEAGTLHWLVTPELVEREESDTQRIRTEEGWAIPHIDPEDIGPYYELLESLKHPKHADRLAPIKEQGAGVLRRFFRAQRRKTIRQIQTHLHVLASHNPNVREADQAAKDKVSEVLPAGSSIPSPVSSGMVIDWSKALHAALEAGYDGLASENDFSGEPTADAISAYLRAHSLEKLTGDIAPTTVDYLRDALADAYESGAGYEELRQAVLDRFDEMSDKRAELIAQTELNNAYNVGRRKLADDMDFNEKSWSADGPAPCPECIGNVLDGWIPIDDPFSSGDMLATAHPGCFCSNDFRFSAAKSQS